MLHGCIRLLLVLGILASPLEFESSVYAAGGVLGVDPTSHHQLYPAERTNCSLIPHTNSFKSLETLISDPSFLTLNITRTREKIPSLLGKELPPPHHEGLVQKMAKSDSCPDTVPLISIKAYRENTPTSLSEMIEKILVPAIERIHRRSFTAAERSSVLKSLELLVTMIETSKADWIQAAEARNGSFQKPAIKSNLLGRINVWTTPKGNIWLDLPDIHIGKGANKSVNLALDYNKLPQGDSHALLAMSVSDVTSKSPVEIENLKKEFLIQKTLSEKGILIVKPLWMATVTKKSSPDSSPSAQKNYLMMATEYFEEGTLTGYAQHFNGSSPIQSLQTLKTFDVDQARTQTSLELLKQLESIHDENICHGDIKPANILVRKLDSNTIHVALADFGAAAEITEIERNFKKESFDLSNHYLGTAPFMAPEIMHMDDDEHSQLKNPQLLKKADVWALGLTFYYMKHKQEHPGCYSEDVNEYALMIQISQIKTHDDLCAQCGIFCDSSKSKTAGPPSGTYDDVVYKMLHPDPYQRISAKEAVKLLNQLNDSYQKSTKLVH